MVLCRKEINEIFSSSYANIEITNKIFMKEI